MFNKKYIRNQETLKTRDIYRIFKAQKQRFIDLLESFDKKAGKYEQKAKKDEIDAFLKEINEEDVEYLLEVLPKIMETGAKPEIAKYKDLLPEGYTLAFDIPTSPASKYLKDLEKLHLSQKDGSISKTTNDEIRKLIADGIDAGKSYWEIAREIQSVDPFVFSKSRANLIAVQEIGQSYWFANFEPARTLESDGYVMMKEWQTSNDDLVRPEHLANQEQGQIPLDQKFSWTGDEYAPSADFRCRCTSSTEIVGIKSLDDIHLLEKYEHLRKHFDK